MMTKTALLQHTCKERFNIWKSMARQKTMDDNDFGIPTAERNKKYCYEFAKKGACTKVKGKGACTKVNCKYMHVAKEAAYPNFSNRANAD